MTDSNRRDHWEKIYETRNTEEVSWYQASPEVSVKIIEENKLPLDAKIIDIGGGDSLFVDFLLDLGFENITVLDISEKAIDKAKIRLGERAGNVKWIIADITEFQTEEKYDFWHDRATFHFLTDEAEISSYLNNAREHLCENGLLVIGTFSEEGPEKCSGLHVRQYSAEGLSYRLEKLFKKLKCFYTNHYTPQGTVQNFVFCSFKKSV